MTNQTIIQMANDLKKASNMHNTPLWARLAEDALKTGSAQRTININRINDLTRDGDTVVFPGKVLGIGNIDHNITIFAFSMSGAAARKIVKAGGNVISNADMVKRDPAGKGVILLG